MGREYKHSVKNSLTRKLVFIIIASVIALYAVVIVIQTTSSQDQSEKTKGYLTDLQITSFEGQLQSRSGQIGQKLQMTVNDLQNLVLNLRLLYDGSLAQTGTADDERAYYWNDNQYRMDTDYYNQFVVEGDILDYVIDGKLQGYWSSFDFLSWEDIQASATTKEALFYISGLAFITNPTLKLRAEDYIVPDTYMGFKNGLCYYVPWGVSRPELDPITDTTTISDSCNETLVPVEDPPPFAGFDCRCRPWYQNSMASQVDDAVTIEEPYVFYGLGMIGLSIMHYVKLEGNGETQEGVMAIDLTQDMFTQELSDLAMQFEKFFFASAEGQNVISASTKDEGNTLLTEIISVRDFLVDQTTGAELEDLRTLFDTDISPQLRNLTETSMKLDFQDGTKSGSSFKTKSLIVAPIKLSLKDVAIENGTNLDDLRSYSFYVGVVPEETQITVNTFELSDLKYYAAILVTLVLSLLLSTYCVFQTSHAVIKPLRILNMRMNEILQGDNYDEVHLDSSSGKCQEIKNLQDQFSDLISDYKFTKNKFIKQESDVLALIDLAQACVLFSGQNYKAVGVCYNNIANLHYKNEKYQLVADSYNKAVHMAYVNLGEITPEAFYEEFETEKPQPDANGNINVQTDIKELKQEQRQHFQTVRAHRYYQFAMCMYKIWRYQKGDDLLEQSQGHDNSLKAQASEDLERNQITEETNESSKLLSAKLKKQGKAVVKKVEQATRTPVNAGLAMKEAILDVAGLSPSQTDRADRKSVHRQVIKKTAATETDWWQFVDQTLQQAIKNYEGLTMENEQGVRQPIFIDLIVKLNICRAYANNMNQRPLTAHRFLDAAEKFIERIRAWQDEEEEAPTDGLSYSATPPIPSEMMQQTSSIRRLRQARPKTKALFIRDDKDRREGAFAIPIDILEQKLLLHKGLVMVSQGETQQAKSYFVRCINTGKVYDPRIRQECVNQLRIILAQDQIIDLKLERLAESFRFRNRDFIFLVNQSPSMHRFKEQTTAILQQIMQPSQDCILNQDRVSLIKFNRRMRRIFSLVPKDSNFAQLKNQVDKLEFNDDEGGSMQHSFLPKALHQACYEFERHKLIKKQESAENGADQSASRSFSSKQNQLLNTMIEQTMMTNVGDSMLNPQTSAQQMQLKHANRRWIVCLSNKIVQQDESGHNLATVAELFVKHQVNIILVCFNPKPVEIKAAEDFVQRIKDLSADRIIPIEAFLLYDASPAEVEELMVKRVANYKIPKNAPLIIETFI